MPDFFMEVEREAAAVGHGITSMFTQRHQAAQVATAAPQTPAQQPVNLAATPVAAATPQGDTMSFITDAESFITRVKAIGEDVVTDVEAIKSNPETAGILSSIAGLAKIAEIPTGLIGSIGAGLAGLCDAYNVPAAAGAPAPVAQTATAQTAVQPAVQ